MLTGRYRTIVVDPPWPYECDGKVLQRQVGYRKSFLPYATMTLGEIKALPVKAMAQSDTAGNRPDKSVPRDGSILYLWTTTSFLCAAHEVARVWGFAPTIILVWCKPHGDATMGGTFAANVEFVIVARRGSPKPAMSSSPTRWFEWPRGGHSAKPDAFYDLVERVSPGPYAELFARRARLGWDYPIGDQALGGVAA